MLTVVHYELYVQEQRGWVLQARFTGDERSQAIAEAKSLELDLRLPVRVMRETYHPQSNEGSEAIVYSGRFKPRAGAASGRLGGRGIEAAGMGSSAPFSQGDIEAQYGANALTRRARGTGDFMFRVILVMVASLILAILGTGVAASIISRSGVSVSSSGQSLFMFLLFMVLFLITAVPLIMKYLPLDQFGNTPSRPYEPKRPSLWSMLPLILFGQPATKAEDKVAAASAQPPDAAVKAADPEAKSVQAEATEPAAAQAPPVDESAIPAPAPSEQPPAPDAAATPEAATVESPEVEKSRLAAMKFLGGAVNAIKATHPQLDAYNKFGVNLYLAGACDALAKARGLNDVQQAALVRECVEVIGTRPDQARQLVERLAGYRSEPRYRQMIAAGFTAMEVYMSGHSDPFIAVGGVMKDWNTPQSRQIANNSVTLMFTDMVGSTDITHAIGDMAAQDIIRAHNHIVRTALSHFGGREVKHTGDGIMASFDEPEDAVRAAVDIQQRAAQHTTRWPKLPLHLRIGMNTGEPIIEENDYFGATVQVAARVCAAAGTGQVWISDATRSQVPSSADLSFHNHGPHTLKGVTDQITLHEVLWTDDSATAQETPKPVAEVLKTS
ncbi:MAG: adenylate/guanylate cyclase domain-containing protein [Rhodospirillaceae bacterium]